jgi:hypothetical protein
VPEWHIQTEDGAEFGPVTRSELDKWHADGRINLDCQILCEGWTEWKWAEEVFAELAEMAEQAEEAEAAESPEADNPFAGIG